MIAFFHPMYRLSGHVLVVTGLVSWWTAWSLRRAWPTLMAMRSPAELERVIAERTEELTPRHRRAEAGRGGSSLPGDDRRVLRRRDRGQGLDGVVTSWNAGAERLFGYTAAEAVGRPITFLIPPDRQDEESAILERLRRGETVDHFESVRVTKDGRSIDVSLTISPIKDRSGRIIGISKIARDITERRTAEDALRLAEEKMRSVVNHVIDGIITIDERGAIQSFNPAAERIFGYAAAEVLGKNVSMLMPEPYHGEHDGYLANYHRTGQPKVIGIGREVEGRRSDGSTFPMDLAVSGFRLGEGRFYTGIVRDITERKQAEEALRASERRFRRLAETLPQLIWSTGPDGASEYASPQWFTYTGLPDARELAARWGEILHPDDRAQVDALWAEAPANGGSYDTEYRMRRHRWRVPMVQGTRGGRPRGGWRGRPLVRDLHRYRRPEARQEASAPSERIYRAIGESIPFGVWICDPDGHNTYASESFLRLVGLTQEQCSQFGWGGVLHPDDAARTIEAWKECVRVEGKWDIEHRVRGTDGQYHPILARGIPVRDEEGRIVCWAGINLDIGRLKAAEASLRQGEDSPRLALSAARLAHWEWDIQADRIPYQDSLSLLYGRPDERPFADFPEYLTVVHPEDRRHRPPRRRAGPDAGRPVRGRLPRRLARRLGALAGQPRGDLLRPGRYSGPHGRRQPGHHRAEGRRGPDSTAQRGPGASCPRADRRAGRGERGLARERAAVPGDLRFDLPVHRPAGARRHAPGIQPDGTRLRRVSRQDVVGRPLMGAPWWAHSEGARTGSGGRSRRRPRAASSDTRRTTMDPKARS